MLTFLSAAASSLSLIGNVVEGAGADCRVCVDGKTSERSEEGGGMRLAVASLRPGLLDSLLGYLSLIVLLDYEFL